MSEALTLRHIVGAPTHPSPLDKAVLVLIDLQREYADGALRLSGVDAAVEQAVRLLALARANGVPVIHIVHHTAPGAPLFDPAGPTAQIIPDVAPQGGEPVIVKRLANAFAGTSLETAARDTGRSEMIIAGFMTHNCVSSTARSAVDHGWRVTVVASATATRDLPDGRGGVVPAAEIQRGVLAGLGDSLTVVVEDAGAWG
ncbi:cysteine hydrolase family protein [Azospirillum picis]|uniref:Nicotinamidase-related amidase n=1 Tax=Azospirillum picis TaxID=488438 RepID=A0ABU0MKF3_9PROT|nr:cysteine hydrolase family protein [Azospirillum picis]MBP2300207.1 nicotinamidase-related amidase [Azospirillum picis]MDQ0533951.1 nicotinamidase-related amidase [Azospirillum picis]